MFHKIRSETPNNPADRICFNFATLLQLCDSRMSRKQRKDTELQLQRRCAAAPSRAAILDDEEGRILLNLAIPPLYTLV